jgi:hypothetical protein
MEADPTLELETLTLGLPPAPLLLLTMAHKRRTAELLSGSTDSTGLTSWRAGCLLAQLLAAHSHALLRGARVVELGCGSALLSCVAAAGGAAAVLATDASADVLALAAHNLARNAPPAAAAAEVATAELRWGEPLPGSLTPRSYSLALAAEVFYLHRGGGLIDGGIGAQASALLGSALQQLLQPCTCAATAAGAGAAADAGAGTCAGAAAEAGPGAAAPCRAGLLLLAYTPRYPGMARAIRAAAAAAGASLRTLCRSAALTPELRASSYFTDTRLLAVCGCSVALEGHVAALGAPPPAPRAEDSDWTEDECVGWEARDAQTPSGVGLEPLFS